MAREHSRTVFVAMSGGVDSSVAAALLKRRGYAVVGVHLRCFNVDGCAARDAEDARRVAGVLGIPFYVFDFEEEYKAAVVDYMVDGYRRGLTPNPDVMCNREIKFGLFLKKALALGADYIATGHYARRREIKNQKSKGKNYVLATARDLNKDQTYFLWTLTQDQLRHCLFPIGEYKKPQVRAMARRFGLPNADKKDSQGICFLGKVALADFLGQYLPERQGPVLTTAGAIIGEHRGVQFYTVGQRHIGIMNHSARSTGSRPQPFYVAGKDASSNTLTVAEGNDHPALFCREVFLRDVSWMSGIYSNVLKNMRIEGMRVFARVRYRAPLSRAAFHYGVKGTGKLVFDAPQKFVAPGQSAVLYAKSGEMLGGGVIAD